MTEEKKKLFLMKFYDTEINIAILILRCFVGVMMLTHTIDKMENFSTIAENFPTPFGINSWVGLTFITIAELGCSIMIIVGIATRLACFIMILAMSTAAFFTFPVFILKQSELAMMYLAIYIVLFILGGGRYAIDRLIHRIYENSKTVKR